MFTMFNTKIESKMFFTDGHSEDVIALRPHNNGYLEIFVESGIYFFNEDRDERFLKFIPELVKKHISITGRVDYDYTDSYVYDPHVDKVVICAAYNTEGDCANGLD